MANEEVKKEVIEPAPAVEEDVDDEPDEWCVMQLFLACMNDWLIS